MTEPPSDVKLLHLMRLSAPAGRLERAREHLGLTTRDVADACLLREADVWLWEGCKLPPRGSDALRYGRWLLERVPELFDGLDPRM